MHITESWRGGSARLLASAASRIRGAICLPLLEDASLELITSPAALADWPSAASGLKLPGCKPTARLTLGDATKTSAQLIV